MLLICCVPYYHFQVHGLTPLLVAAVDGHVAIVDALIAAGANVNVLDKVMMISVLDRMVASRVL